VAAKLLDISATGRHRIDRYELIGEIASGGMATVFLARLTGLGGFQRFVALKRLHPHLQAEKDFVRMFLDEARLAAGIHHPNVVPILEVGAGSVGYYLVMEYIEGETLARLLARAASAGTKLPVAISLRIGIDMLRGLHAAHELKDETGAPTNLVHRDVSPQNVLVGSDGVSRITDFGVARAASRLGDTRAGQLKGKIAYMAPEQASGVEELDRRADIFASGIVLWEALAQRRLFKAQNEAATLSRVMNEPVPNLSAIAADVPDAITKVISRSLERLPERRFPTCAEFADTLEDTATRFRLVASSRDLSNYVADVMGDEIAQQREAVRAWLAQSEASGSVPNIYGPPSSSVSAAAMSMPDYSGIATAPGRSPMRRQSSKAPWIAGALVLVAGGAGAFLWSEQHDPGRGVNAGATTLTPSATVDPPVPPAHGVTPPPTGSGAHQPEKISLDEVAAEQTPAASAPAGAGRDADNAPSHARTGSRKGGSSRKPRKQNLPDNPYEF
jgi:serine/threonine-protein kinase